MMKNFLTRLCREHKFTLATKVCLFAFAAVVQLLSHSAEAQQPAKIRRIGFLSALSPSPATSAGNVEAFRQALGALGWIEGQNIDIEYRWAEGKYERLPELAANLVRLKVDVIVTNASRAAIAAKEATATIPIVFEVMGDPVSMGLVASLSQPGGNLTGVSGFGPELSGKQVELLKEVVPRLNRLAVLANLTSVGAAAAIQESEVAAKALGVRLFVVNVEVPEKIDGAFASIAKHRADAVLVPADAMLASQRKRVLRLVEKHRLPAMYVETPSWVVNGGLMSYSASLPDQFRKVAGYVDKILKGAKPADLPVQQPTKFELIINLIAAKQIGLTIPQSVLYRADKVIR
jgi:putative tryptophan/tyrosine transport system substrate-binding protein